MVNRGGMVNRGEKYMTHIHSEFNPAQSCIGVAMFKVVAVLFVIVNGAPTDKVISIDDYAQGLLLFDTVEKCMDFLNTTTTGKDAVESMQRIAERLGAAAEVVCVAVEKPGG
jgi:hypothetical protein